MSMILVHAVKDKEGRIKRGKAATGVWKDHFKEVLNAGGNLSQKSTVEDQVLEAEPQGHSGGSSHQ